jgi:hypothetical protein
MYMLPLDLSRRINTESNQGARYFVVFVDCSDPCSYNFVLLLCAEPARARLVTCHGLSNLKGQGLRRISNYVQDTKDKGLQALQRAT